MNITIDFLFNVLNLIARIALAAFLIRRYVVKSVKLSILHEKNDLDVLHQEQISLQQACLAVDEQIKQDEQTFNHLKSKFGLWNQQVEQKLQQENIQADKRKQRIEFLLEKKIEHLQRRHIIEVEIAQLLEQTSASLQQQFIKSPALAQQYQTKLVQALQVDRLT